MSRYQDDNYDEEFNNQADLWFANVKRHLGGKAGQAVLRELRDALLALPEPVLISGRLANEQGQVCTVGALALHRGVPADELAALIPPDSDDGYEEELQTQGLSARLGLKQLMGIVLAQENDDVWRFPIDETPEQRYQRILGWVNRTIKEEVPA